MKLLKKTDFFKKMNKKNSNMYKKSFLIKSKAFIVYLNLKFRKVNKMCSNKYSC